MRETLRKNIEISKQKYYSILSRKLATDKINPKCYWSILRSFLNNKKIPCIPPLIHNQFVVDFKEKGELFNSFFAKQFFHHHHHYYYYYYHQFIYRWQKKFYIALDKKS